MQRIIGGLEEFKDQANKRFDKIDGHLEDLKSFKWKVLGMSTLLSFLVTIAISAIRLLK